MLVLKLCTNPAFGMMAGRQLTTVGRVSLQKSSKTSPWITRIQCISNDSRSTLSRMARRRTLKEMAMAPAQGTAFNVGKGALVGASALGIGALCFYGLGLSNKEGILEQSMLWPDYVKSRIHSTYMYFGGSIIITAASAMAVLRSPAVLNMMMKNSWLAIGATLVAMMGTGMLARSIPYSEGFGSKQMAWMLHSSVMGAVIAPLCLLGGPIILKAALYTAGVVSGLSAVAVCAPSDKFLNMGGPLAIGLGVVFASSLGSMFLPATTVLGSGLYSIAMYGGLVLFSGYLLYDTQRIVRVAEMHPFNAVTPFDPVNASISIYMDTMNIFIRIVQLLAMGGGSRRK